MTGKYEEMDREMYEMLGNKDIPYWQIHALAEKMGEAGYQKQVEKATYYEAFWIDRLVATIYADHCTLTDKHWEFFLDGNLVASLERGIITNIKCYKKGGEE